MYLHTKYYVVLHDLAVAQPQMALNVIIVKVFLIDLDGGVCQRDLNEGQFTYINYELSCCGGGVMLCFAVSIVLK